MSVKGRPIIREPIEVEIALSIDQITDIDQKKENFTVVGNLWMKWIDPDFAFNTDSCKCNQKDYTPLQFDEFINENHLNVPVQGLNLRYMGLQSPNHVQHL